MFLFLGVGFFKNDEVLQHNVKLKMQVKDVFSLATSRSHDIYFFSLFLIAKHRKKNNLQFNYLHYLRDNYLHHLLDNYLHCHMTSNNTTVRNSLQNL